MAAQYLLPALVAAGLLTAPGGARAQVTADQAKSVETQLRDWLAGLVRPALDVGERPVLVEAEGDHFRMRLPAPDVAAKEGAAKAGIVPAGLQLSWTARPMDGGRWALEELRFPSPFSLTMPAAAGGKPMTTNISATTQDFHAVFDPSFATTSSFDSALTNFRTTSPQSTTTVAKVTGHSVWQPAGDGRINVLGESGSDRIDVSAQAPDGGKVSYTIDKSRLSTNLKGVAPASLAMLARSIAALAPTIQDKQDTLTAPQRELARAIVFAARDMIGGAELGETVEGLRFAAAGHSASLRKLTVGGTLGAPEGRLALAADIAMEGLDSPEIPKGLFRDYLPRRVTLKPRVSGIPSEDVVKLLLRAIDSDAKDMESLQADAIGLLAAGPLEVALDDLMLDLGPLKLSGNGSVEIAGPTDISGDAEITVTGLNALIKRANTAPELKELAPVLIFLKGIGKQDKDSTVWELAYDNGSFTVNDTDMSALMPGGAPSDAKPRGKKAKP
jgi:hypothetical protein